MKETRADGAVNFNDGGEPWRVADRSLRGELAEVFTEATDNVSKFSSGFNDVLVSNASFIFEDKLLDLFFERIHFFAVQADFILFLSRPNERSIEGLGG